MESAAKRLTAQDARKTYRYLRIGMIGAVVLLAASVMLERTKVDCWQTSISAYYYTPVRAIFVGGLIAVGLSLIVYKGHRWEDASLNLAGMLAPVVAIAPTTDVGDCWSVEPIPLPVKTDGSLANWVVTNIENNFYSLLIAGTLGLIVAFVIASLVTRSVRTPLQEGERETRLSLGLTAVALAIAWLLIQNWDDFYTRAHGYAAILMFAGLILAIVAHALHRKARSRPWILHMAIAAAMVLGGVAIWLTRLFDDHTVFALETYEIALFALYWSLQTRENWNEEILLSEPTKSQAQIPAMHQESAIRGDGSN